MSTKIDKTSVSKPRKGLRSEIAALPVNGSITLKQAAIPQDGESGEEAAIRVSKWMRNTHSRSVTDARQRTGFTLSTLSSRNWDTETHVFECSFTIIRKA